MIRLAKSTDIDVIFDIRQKAALRLKQLNIYQWQQNEPSKARFLLDIEKNWCFVYETTSILAMMTIQEDQEVTYKNLVNLNERALTIHRFAVHDNALNQGIATLMMEFAISRAQLKKVKWLYIDTHPDNLIMQGLIHKFHFEYVGDFDIPFIASPKRKLYRRLIEL
jgi:ribosomal protein S18 acetylase RimI-like enzyme